MKRALIIDDEPLARMVVKEYLQNFDQIEVIQECNDGFEGVKAIARYEPDLIFLDYNMGSLNGIETLKKIKRFNPNSLVVFISGQEEIAVAVNALKYGAFDYLVKSEVDELKLKTVMEKAYALNTLLEKNRKKSGLRKLLSSVGLSGVIFFIYKHFAK